MTQNKLNIIFIVFLIVIFIGSQALFSVDQREQALVLQLGNPVGEPRKPGLHFKIPFIQEVKIFDGRILSVDPKPEQVVIASSTIARDQSRADAAREKAANAAKTEAERKAEAEAKIEEAKDVVVTERPKIENVSGEPIIVDSFARYSITDPLQFLKTLGTISIANTSTPISFSTAARYPDPLPI